MPQNITLPFHTIKLRLNNGDDLSFPLSDPNAFHLGIAETELAEKFATQFQRKQLDKGQILGLLDLLRDGEFQTKKIIVPFAESPDGISFPEFELEFDYIVQPQNEAFWGMIPALGLETLSGSEAELEHHLMEVVRIEFSSKKRMQSVFQIIAASWFDNASVVRSEIKLKTWSPAELVENQRNKQLELLPKVAEKMAEPNPQAFGREEELSQMERILKGRFSRNLLLVGASGTGKTALVQELVHRKKRLGIEADIWETTASVLIKELTTETGWQDNTTLLVKELTLKGDVLFVRNLAELFEVGRYEGNSVSMAEYLRSAIGRGEITLIGECTPEERARIELRSPGYLAHFQTVQVTVPKSDVEAIILQKIKNLADRRNVSVEPEAVHEIVRLHRRFSPYSGMLGKPIRFLESILLGLSDKPFLPKKKKNKATEIALGQVAGGEFTEAITRSLVLKNYCEESGLPNFMVDPAVPMDVSAIRKSFNANVFGQERAVEAVVDMLATVKTALSRTGKPIASFLFAGPTGVGKTELAKVLATTMFGSRERLLRFDMSEYSSPWSVMRLTGEGYYSDGLLTSAVRRDPFCVLLFDEIEKADSKFYELLLQILSEGRLSDSRGRTVNFCSAIIIMTTNIGAANLQRNRISWKKELGEKDVTEHFSTAIEQHFRPELYNRMDAIVAFAPLDPTTVRFVVEREIDLLRKREGIRFRHLDLNIDDAVLEYLANVGYEARFGARYLQRAIREQLTVPLAEELNQFAFDERLSVQVGMQAGKINVEVDADPLGFDLLMEQWDKLTLAEKTSHQRRRIALLMESPLFLRFESEIDMLESEKNRTGAEFWKNTAQAKRHFRLLETQDRAQSIFEKIQALEVEISLACMEQGPFLTDYESRFEAWEASFFELQVELHSLIFPKRDNCRIAIYGIQLTAALPFYLSIFKAKNFLVKEIQAVWFREGYRGEANIGSSASPKSKEKAFSYFYQPMQNLDAQHPKFNSEKPGDLLCGVELLVNGPSVFLYLGDEKGFQTWMTREHQEPFQIYVQTSMAEIKTPDDIHRQGFYLSGKPRRQVYPFNFSDTKLGLATQLPPLENVAPLIQKLDEIYEIELTRAFLNNETED
ncbi:MAG: AAA domain-containing protein [Bacteroidetes bacterium]|nr:AAA domain-containing protein [Bacteroidota bacterium]